MKHFLIIFATAYVIIYCGLPRAKRQKFHWKDFILDNTARLILTTFVATMAIMYTQVVKGL